MGFWIFSLFIFLNSVAVGTQAITCQRSAFHQQANQISVDPISSSECAQGCRSIYFNDGWLVRYELGCADAASCPQPDACTITDDKTRICCCSTDNCVHAHASEPVTFSFPPHFYFSTATAAYQIEGGAAEDGKGPSIWDVFTHKPHDILNGDTGDIACDSYHRWREDVALLRALNVTEYRFSISWPRVLPFGTPDKVNAVGVKYYNDLLDALIEAKITPVVTIFHWDLPQVFQDAGGFLNDGIVERFADYARFIFATFGTKISKYVTINEPLSIVKYEYCGEAVVHAPGEFKAHCDWAVYQAAHNLLLCHARTVQIFRTEFQQKFTTAQLGITLSGTWYFPETDTQADRDAVERGFQFTWGWWAHPIFSADGDYPAVMRERIDNASTKAQRRLTSRLPAFTPAQKALLKGSADFVGINYYRSLTARARKESEYDWMGGYLLAMDSGIVTDVHPEWEMVEWISIVPQGLRQLLNKFNQEFPKISILITENGIMDTVNDVGTQDNTRIKYLRSHLAAVAQAIEDGVHVIGYTLWSLMDNFEWTSGYSDKFGIHAVDFGSPNRTRTPKASADFYRRITVANSVPGFSPTGDN